ncbi:MAG: Abi-like protein [Tenericutes bacterium ADurb.Bin239]|nr:MAG: Abi-like protein [Tenericutes bacterium ADurb.Bin239]
MKKFKTLEKQLNILKIRGLEIPDDIEEVLKILHKENYYSLINGYKELFLIPPLSPSDKSERFIKGATFNEIFSLCVFDRNIRALLLKSILKIENEFKSYVAYEFSLNNRNRDNYLQLASFNNSKDNLNIYEKKIEKISKLIAGIHSNIFFYYDRKGYIKHYVNEYGFVPFWVLVNTISFGKISTFFSLMKADQQVNIAKNYNIAKKDLNRYMKVLSEVRNICAHDERLYNIALSKESEIRDTTYHRLLGIPQKNMKYCWGKNDFFAILIILKRIMKKEEYETLMNQINNELGTLLSKLKSIKKENLMVKMGLPTNWLDLVTL